MRKEDDSIKNEDWRHQAITTLKEDFNSPSGTIHPAGTPVSVISGIKYGNGKLLTFSLPNMTALLLNQAFVLWEDSNLSLQEENFLEHKGINMPEKSIYPKNTSILFDLIEKRMGSIVFAFSALEAFTNEYIPEDYTFEKERADKKYTEKYSKEQVENTLSLDIKLGEILPEVFKTKSPKGKAIWNKYKDLKSLRDRIIHMKSKDRASTMEDKKTIWSDLLDKSKPNSSIVAKEIIGYFLENTEEKPRWYENFPHQ